MYLLNLNWIEGSNAQQGINWGWDKASQPRIAFRFWRLMIYFRRRSSWIMAGNTHSRRYIFNWDWGVPIRFGRIGWDWARKSFYVADRYISQERVEEFIEREGVLEPTIPNRG